jgi:hypothetical protein
MSKGRSGIKPLDRLRSDASILLLRTQFHNSVINGGPGFRPQAPQSGIGAEIRTGS